VDNFVDSELRLSLSLSGMYYRIRTNWTTTLDVKSLDITPYSYIEFRLIVSWCQQHSSDRCELEYSNVVEYVVLKFSVATETFVK